MATTMLAMSLPSSPPASPDPTGQVHCCPSCGFNLPPQAHDMGTASVLLEAQRTIAELRTQVQLLSQKRTDVVDLRAADNINSLPTPPPSATFQPILHPQQQQQQQQDRLIPPPSPSRTSFSRISALLTRKSVPNLTPPPQQLKALPSPYQSSATSTRASGTPATPNEANGYSRPPSQEVADALESAADFAAALAREQSLRRRAEEKYDATHREIDDLSATLFTQANEMVAHERKANAVLEERVATLEQRDHDKRKRLDRLESAMNSIERARTVLNQRNST